MEDTNTFLAGGGAAGKLIRGKDWSEHALGKPENWPDSLKSAISIALNSAFPIAIYWGKEFILLYNDPWSKIPGDKHPFIFGERGHVAWPEIWDVLDEEFNSVLENGRSIHRPDALLLMNRYGYVEECYFDYTLSPIKGMNGSIDGVFNAVIETTYRVINERRTAISSQFLQHLHDAESKEAAANVIHDIIDNAPYDIPFSLLYVTDGGKEGSYQLINCNGISYDNARGIAWNNISASISEILYIDDISKYLDKPFMDIWGTRCTAALKVPISKGHAQVNGFVVLGISSRKQLDASYQSFLEAVGLHMGTIMNIGGAYEQGEHLIRERALNYELEATNEALNFSNDQLQQVQESLKLLNQELEKRVLSRTAELLTAQRELEGQHERLTRFFMQAPASICVLNGENLIYELVNPLYQALFPGRKLFNKPLLEALPELKGGLVDKILQGVYQTGKTYYGKELHIPLARYNDGPVEDRYFNFIYQARRNGALEIDGILVFAFEVTDSVLSKRKVEESEMKLRSLVMSSHNPLMILRGENWIIEIANHQLANLWDQKLEDIIGRPLLEVQPALADQSYPIWLKQVYETGIGYGQEEEVLYLKTDEGLKKKYISFHYDPLKGGDGSVNGIIVAASDITAIVESRKRIEESEADQQALNEELSSINEEFAVANEELIETNNELSSTQAYLQNIIAKLAESEERFRKTAREAPVAIASVSGDILHVDLANKKMLELWGKDESIVGKTLTEIAPELEDQGYIVLIQAVKDSKKTYYGNSEHIFIEQQGELVERYFNFIYQPSINENGVAESVMVVAVDVTDQVYANRAVEASEKRFRFLLDAVPQQVWTSDALGTLTYVNQVVCDDFGFSSEEMIKSGLQKFIHPEDIQHYQNAYDEALKTANEFVVEIRFLMKEGHYKWHLERALPLIEEGQVKMWVGTNTDIDLQKNNEQKKDEFISIASHELKTPLTTIKAFNQLMSRTQDSSKLASYVRKSSENILRLEWLINDLLDVTKINAGKIIYNMLPFNFNKLLEDSVESVQQTSPNHKVVLETVVNTMYHGDQYRLEQVMHNFLSNAVKYSPEGGEIVVNSKIEDNHIIVSVRDFGIGIAKDHLDRLFDRYYRVNTNTMHFEGLGLGLFISSEILKRHHGSFWIESVLGKGSVFFFKLPLNGIHQT